jgi:hypothetical protein
MKRLPSMLTPSALLVVAWLDAATVSLDSQVVNRDRSQNKHVIVQPHKISRNRIAVDRSLQFDDRVTTPLRLHPLAVPSFVFAVRDSRAVDVQNVIAFRVVSNDYNLMFKL